LRFSGREYLRYLGKFSDLRDPELSRRVEQELSAVGLLEAADRRLATYSKGMLQRLGIAQALLADPDILLIDEPTSGLDPSGQREMLSLLAELRSRNHTIFLTTHQLGEIEQLCDTVGVLFGGKLAAEIDVQSLRVPSSTAVLTVGQMSPDLVAQLERIAPSVRCSGREIVLQPNTRALQTQVLRVLLDADVPIIALAPQGRPLEEIYMRIVRGEPVTLPQPEPPRDLFARPAPPEPGATLPATAPNGPSPGRPRPSETLLRELMRDDREHGGGPQTDA
jgi:ABC-2 type transport system ATP-binding protein